MILRVWANALPVLLLVASLGCGGSSKRDDRPLSERVAECELHCADVAMALVEHELYEEAKAPIEKAFRHAEDPGRPDVPWAESPRKAHLLRLSVARAVRAHHAQPEEEPAALEATWRTFETFLEDASFDGLDAAELTFLTRADRLWILRMLEEADAVDPNTRDLMTLVWRANSDMAVDRLLLGELSDGASTPRQHLLAVHLLCEAGECASDATVRHVGALVEDQMRRDVDERNERLLEAQELRTFMRVADSQYTEHVLWLRDIYVHDDVDVPLAIPIAALGRGRACREFAASLASIVRDSKASYEALVDSARCLVSLGYKSWALRLLARARVIEESPVEAITTLVEYEALKLHPGHLSAYVDELEDTPGHGLATRYLSVVRALDDGRFVDAAAKAASLPNNAVSSYLRGLIALSRGDLEEAEQKLEHAARVWRLTEIGYSLHHVYVGLGRPEKALEQARAGMELRPSAWRHLLGMAAAAAGDDGELERAHGEVAESSSCGSYVTTVNFGVLLAGPVVALESLDKKVATARRRRIERCAGSIASALGQLLSAEEAREHIAGWRLTSSTRTEILSHYPRCDGPALEAKRRALADSLDDVGSQNSLAWCHCERGEYEDAAAVLHDPGENTAIRDTFARIQLETGHPEKAVEMFEELVEEAPDRNAYLAHMLVARLRSADPPSELEVTRTVHRLVRWARLRSTDQYIWASLAAALDEAGHADLARDIHRARAKWISALVDWRTIDADCPDCRQAYVDWWGTRPPVATTSTAPKDRAAPNEQK